MSKSEGDEKMESNETKMAANVQNDATAVCSTEESVTNNTHIAIY